MQIEKIGYDIKRDVFEYNLVPQNDRVLIQRIEDVPRGTFLLTDRSKSIKGIVLAVGPGKWIPGTWWHLYEPEPHWEWLAGHRQPLTVKPGDKVLFNSKWNDFAAGENKGTGSDLSGPLERPLAIGADPTIHLVQEADIFGIVPDFNFTVSLKDNRPPYMQNFSIAEV